MKRVVLVLVGLLLLISFAGTVAFLVYKASERPVEFSIHHGEVRDVVKKTVATGALVPRAEVEIKSRVSGIVDEVFKEAGDGVEIGDLIARIRIVPDPQALDRASSNVRMARINLQEASRQLREDEIMREEGAISQSSIERRRTEVALREEELRASEANYILVREGSIRNADHVATDVRSTMEGMVLSVEVKAGESVIESNTFNAGTTVAAVADMSDMIFEGKVDESEVGRIEVGMPLTITVGALNNRKLAGKLEHISPKGKLEDGAVQFAIKAAIEPVDGVFIRAGSSANADIVLDRREQVLAVKEAWLRFEGVEPYVEVEVGVQLFERRDVQLGLSDGIFVEVLGGVDASASLKGSAVGE